MQHLTNVPDFYVMILYISLLTFFNAAMYCGPLPDILNADLNMTSLIYMSIASVQCNKGFLFLESIRSLLVTCTAEGTWNATADVTIANNHINYNGIIWDIRKVNCSSMFYDLFRHIRVSLILYWPSVVTTVKAYRAREAHTSMHTRPCAHVRARMRACAHAHTHTHKHTPTRTLAHTHTHTQMYIRTCSITIHTLTHTLL